MLIMVNMRFCIRGNVGFGVLSVIMSISSMLDGSSVYVIWDRCSVSDVVSVVMMSVSRNGMIRCLLVVEIGVIVVSICF